MEPLVKTEPVLKLNFLSHGTLECTDIEATRKFYEEFLGLETVRTSKISMTLRLNSSTVFVAVQVGKKSQMPLMAHNGLDVATPADVDKCHEIVMREKDQWGIKKVTTPIDQHGTRSFYFLDLDDNWWEILANPEGGYTWQFNKGSDFDYAKMTGDDNPNSFVGRRSPNPTPTKIG
ncbi:MAG TPA: VOC family protein [Candidatus Binatia bacterium]|nr:VOC family protein [Candidatus Binatia bacterium]